MSIDKIQSILACEIECGVFERHVLPALNVARHALSVDAQPVAEAWQPIETAPKDGRMFLVWVEAARFGEDDNGQPFEQDCSTADFAEWRKCGDDGYINYFAHPFADREYATHWQPLPAPPAALSQHTGENP